MALTEPQFVELTELLTAIEPELKSLNPRERDFVSDQLKRHAQYGQAMFFSPKQWKWLKDIYERVTGDVGISENDPEDDDWEQE